jgi:hypothetical protein
MQPLQAAEQGCCWRWCCCWYCDWSCRRCTPLLSLTQLLLLLLPVACAMEQIQQGCCWPAVAACCRLEELLLLWQRWCGLSRAAPVDVQAAQLGQLLEGRKACGQQQQHAHVQDTVERHGSCCSGVVMNGCDSAWP